VLLKDEATSALDPQTTRSILKLLHDLNKRMGLTILPITHEMAVVKQICDSVAILHAGEIVEQGRVSDLIAKPNSLLKAGVFLCVVILVHHVLARRWQRSPSLFEVAQVPIFAMLARRFDVDVNIMKRGSVETIGDRRIGQFQVELEGDKIRQTLEYLHESKFEVEVH
jgi:D-methionine transport system ATP-binding protein